MKYGNLEEKTYQEINSKVIDSWCRDGWEWGTPIDHETFLRAKEGDWNVLCWGKIALPFRYATLPQFLMYVK